MSLDRSHKVSLVGSGLTRVVYNTAPNETQLDLLFEARKTSEADQ